MPKSCFIEINVYNILGRKVASLFKGNKQAGFHTITWNASTFSSGVYFIKMKTPHFSDTKKCILLNPNYTLVNVGVQFIEPYPNVSMRINPDLEKVIVVGRDLPRWIFLIIPRGKGG